MNGSATLPPISAETPPPAAVVQPGPPPAAAFDARELGRTLSAQRWLIATCTALIVLGTGLYGLAATPFYRSQLRVLIERDGEHVLQFQEIYNLGTGTDDYYVTQFRVLESRAVAEAALALLPAEDRAWFERHEQPVVRLMKLRRIAPVSKSRLVDVITEHPSPETSQRMAEAFVQAYIDNVEARRSSASVAALDKLRAQETELSAKLDDALQAVQTFRREHRIISFSDQQSLVAARLEKLSEELADVERQRREAESRVNALGVAVADASLRNDLPEVLQSQVIADHKRELLEAQETHSGLAQKYRPKHPRMQQLSRRISSIEAQLQTEVDTIHRGLRQNHGRLVRHEEDVRARLAEQSEKMLALEQLSIEFGILKSEADNARHTYETVRSRLEEVEVINDHQTSNVHRIGRAEVTDKPVRPRKLLNLALALVVGLLLSCGVAFAADALDSSIKTPADAGQTLGLPVLGLVPRLEGKRVQRGQVDPETFDARSSLSEAFRTIRTNFTFSEAGRDMRSLVVTSATPEEGKSMVSINLAVALGRAGKRVLLVDADLRRPRLHRAFDIEAEQGLSSVLLGTATVEQLALPTQADNVWLLPCGIVPPNPVELLCGDHTHEFVASALAQYDVVLIDSPPVGVVSDACVLATLVDRVVFVVRSFKAHRGHCRRSVQQLLSVGARIAGCIVNHCDVRADRYDNRYEYGYVHYEYAEASGRRAQRGVGKPDLDELEEDDAS